MGKSKLPQQEINLDDLIKDFKPVDAEEIADIRGVDYVVPRAICDIATKMSIEMRRKKSASIHVANSDIIPEVRRLLLNDLNRIGSQHRVFTICNDKNNDLIFKYVAMTK